MLRAAERPQEERDLGAAKHIPALDGVRGIAVLMVMVYHFGLDRFGPYSPLLRIVSRSTLLGQTGVDLFFVLSGFLITGILLSAKGGDHYFRNFYMRRTLRIFPLYYGMLLLLLIVLPLVHREAPLSLSKQWWHWLYLHNVASTFWPDRIAGGSGHFWSLAVEEHFYFLWPAIVLFTKDRLLVRVCLAVVGCALVCRAVLIVTGYEGGTFCFTFSRMDALAMGAAVAVIARRPGGLGLLDGTICKLLALLVVLMLPLYVMFSGSHSTILQIVKFPAIACFYTLSMIFILNRGSGTITHRVFTLGPLRACGKYSYSMYVFHPFTLGWALKSKDWLILDHPNTPSMIQLAVEGLLGFGFTFGVAWLSWHLYEMHFLKLKRFFEYGVRPRPLSETTMSAGRSVGARGCRA